LSPADSVLKYLFFSSWRALYFLAFSTAYYLVRRLIIYRQAIATAERAQLIALKENALLEKDNAELRYAYLQQQINPHFLFNTLNFIYTTVYKVSREAADAVVMLSDVMRYSLETYDGSGKTVLSAEVEQIRTLVALHRMRYEQDELIELNLSGEPEGLTIIPLVLLTLAENMLKHGNFGPGTSPATIHIAVDDRKRLRFGTRNEVKRKRAEGNGGIGLANVRKRLEHSYPGAYSLEIAANEEEFVLELKIQL
jgi:LytS/YehU family sensor histidine kinase